MGGFFDSDDNFEVHRRNLPHRRQVGVIYFVTFHLADSLPTKRLAALEKERKICAMLSPAPVSRAQAAKSPPSIPDNPEASPRSERPLCGESLSQLLNLGHGFSDLRLG
jgi:hypothetical protein